MDLSTLNVQAITGPLIASKRDVPPKCSNCAGAHPANYRGCLIARELQIRRNNLISERPQKPQPRTFTANKVASEVPFVQAVKVNKTIVQNDEPSMVQMMQNMMDNSHGQTR